MTFEEGKKRIAYVFIGWYFTYTFRQNGWDECKDAMVLGFALAGSSFCQKMDPPVSNINSDFGMEIYLPVSEMFGGTLIIYSEFIQQIDP